jgi:hypothetical protein
MDANQITAALDRIFNEEGKRIVFWHDPEQEFLDFIAANPTLQFGSTPVHLIRLDQTGALETKIRLERTDPTGRYLLYAPTEEPDYENDWLLDIRLYSRSFRADRASIILDELGLANQHLRQHLADRRKFFDSKERLQKLKPLVAADDTAVDLDRKMIAVVVKADQPELFTIIRTLFHAYTENGEDIDLDTPPPAWGAIEKFDLAEPFWQMIQIAFGYTDDDPSLKKLLIRLLVTDYAYHLKAEVPAALQHLLLPSPGRSNAVVCLAQCHDVSSGRADSRQPVTGTRAPYGRHHRCGRDQNDRLPPASRPLGVTDGSGCARSAATGPLCGVHRLSGSSGFLCFTKPAPRRVRLPHCSDPICRL